MEKSKVLKIAARMLWYIGWICLLIGITGFNFESSIRVHCVIVRLIFITISILIGQPLTRVSEYFEGSST